MPYSATSYSSLLLVAFLLLVSRVEPWSTSSISRRDIWKAATKSITTGSLMLVVVADEEEQQGPTSTKTATTTVSPLTEEEKAAIQQRLLERRQLMEASRSSNNRQSYLDLSRQRAALYNTTSRAANCPPGIPCL